MQNFFLILSLYYGCDALIAHKPLSLTPTQLAQCLGYYEEVKAAFSADGHLPRSGTPQAEPVRRAAYAAFKTWEQEHALFTDALRAEAVALVTRP